MLLKTSINNTLAVVNRIIKLNGIIATPEGHCEAIIVRRIWLFGSTARHKKNPNDTDLLFDLREIGCRKRAGQAARGRKQPNTAKIDKIYKRRYGIDVAKCSRSIFLKYLRGNLKMVRFHDANIDAEYAVDKILVYPRNDLNLRLK